MCLCKQLMTFPKRSPKREKIASSTFIGCSDASESIRREEKKRGQEQLTGLSDLISSHSSLETSCLNDAYRRSLEPAPYGNDGN